MAFYRGSAPYARMVGGEDGPGGPTSLALVKLMDSQREQ